MENKTSKGTEKNIVVSINGKEINKIPLKNVIDRWQTVIDIVTIESCRNPDIRTAKGLYVRINGKNVLPKDVMNMDIEDVQTIDIFGGTPIGNMM